MENTAIFIGGHLHGRDIEWNVGFSEYYTIADPASFQEYVDGKCSEYKTQWYKLKYLNELKKFGKKIGIYILEDRSE